MRALALGLGCTILGKVCGQAPGAGACEGKDTSNRTCTNRRRVQAGAQGHVPPPIPPPSSHPRPASAHLHDANGLGPQECEGHHRLLHQHQDVQRVVVRACTVGGVGWWWGGVWGWVG